MNNLDEKGIINHLSSSSKVLEETSLNCSKSILDAALKISKSIKIGGKLLLCGNGGSSSDTQHIESEFLATLNPKNYRPPLPAISLSNNTAFITAYSNDFSYDNIFSRQIEALGNQNDVLLAISTSGNSKNIRKALETAKKKDIFSVFLTSQKKPTSFSSYNLSIIVPSDNTQHIQEAHITIGHALTRQVEIFLGY